jgi:Rrf2 family iron-sulfur cluster assembly transcriptional regulator
VRITKWGEYAILCSLYLAHHWTKTGDTFAVSALEIADTQNIPIQYTHQILLKLKQGNIIESVRGPRGGYRLRTPPASITLKDIFLAAEGETLELLCDNGPVFEEACSKAGRCGLRGVWFELREAVNGVLMKYTLDVLLENHTIGQTIDSGELIQLSRK